MLTPACNHLYVGLCHELLEEQWCPSSEAAGWFPHLWPHLPPGFLQHSCRCSRQWTRSCWTFHPSGWLLGLLWGLSFFLETITEDNMLYVHMSYTWIPNFKSLPSIRSVLSWSKEPLRLGTAPSRCHMPTTREPGLDMTMLRASRLRYEVLFF